MSYLRKEIDSLIKKDDPTPSLFYWTSLLNFFERNVDELDIDDVRVLTNECERCRVYWNTDKESYIELKKASGKITKIKTFKAGLGIEKKDTNPNLYEHLAEMERREYQKAEAKKQTSVARDRQMIPMAAMSA